MTLNEIAYSILESVNSYKITTSERIPLRLLYDKIHAARATIIKNRLPSVDDNLYQRLECLEIEDYQMECDGYVSDATVKIVRIPGTMSILDSKEFLYFGFDSFNEKNRINIVGFSNFMTYGFRRFSKRQMIATSVPEGLAVRIDGKCNAKYFTAITILNNPLEAPGCVKLTPDDSYPIPADFRLEMDIIIKKDIMSTLRAFPGDFKHEASDNPAAVVQKPINTTLP